MTKHLFTLGAGFIAALFLVGMTRPGILPWTERRADIIRAEAEAGRIAAAADLERLRAGVEIQEREALIDMARRAGAVPVVLLVVMGGMVVILSGLLAVVLILGARRGGLPRPAPAVMTIGNVERMVITEAPARPARKPDEEPVDHRHQESPYMTFYAPVPDGWVY